MTREVQVATGTVRVGMIGAGAQGRFYAELIAAGRAPHLALAAMCGRSAATGERVAEQFPGVPYFSDAIAMMDSGTVDAVIITVPHYDHPQMAIDALERGLHVLVEKPLGVYTKQVRRMLEAAERAPGVSLAAMFNQRAHPLYARLKSIIGAGEIGDVRRVTWNITNWWRPQAYYDSSSWRGTWGGEGGGVLINQAAHQLDLWQWLFSTPRSVWAKAGFGFGHHIAVEDDVTAVFDYGAAGTGVLITGTHDMFGVDQLEILGERGKILVTDSKRATVHRLPKTMREYSETMDPASVEGIMRGEVDASELGATEIIEGTAEFGRDHAVVLENFGRAITLGEPLLAPAAEGADAVRLSNAILLSAWLGHEVPFDFDDDLFVAELNARIVAEGAFPLRD